VIYLDTHVVIWLYEGVLDRFPDFAKNQMESNDLMISPMVELELQYLYEIKRINRNSRTIINELTHKIGLEISKEPLYTIIQSAIPLHWTRDPFDRLIVANAHISNTMLLTKDTHIAAHYKHVIWD
jgi:PIN domain nuclease of toxin-antitoxin system